MMSSNLRSPRWTLEGSICLVTGGAGFIGSNLVDRLLGEGAQVRVLDILETGKESNLESAFSKINFWKADVRDRAAVVKVMQGADYVFHLAAVSSVPRSLLEPDLTFSSNIMGTLNVLMASKESGIKRVINVSSSSIYGNIPDEMKNESLLPKPVSPYAISKYTAELITRNYFDVFGLDTVTLRYFNVFGPRQDPHSPYAAVIPKFLNALIAGEAPVVFGDGTQARDFTFVYDTVEATLLALQQGRPGEIYNVGAGRLTTLNELLEELYAVVGKRVAPVYSERRIGDVFRSGADITKAKREFGYDAKTSVMEGLQKTVNWMKVKDRCP